MAFYYHLSSDVIPEEMVSGVFFNISRYGEWGMTMTFRKPMSVLRAIKYAESFLSKPMTEEYHAKYASTEGLPFPFKEGQCRGYLLGDCRFLENITIEDGVATLSCGS